MVFQNIKMLPLLQKLFCDKGQKNPHAVSWAVMFFPLFLVGFSHDYEQQMANHSGLVFFLFNTDQC